MQVVRGRYSSLNLPGGLFYVFCCKWKLLEREFLRQPGVRLLAARGRGLGFRAIHKIYQLFAGLEEGNFLGRHFDLLAGFRIAADASAALARAEAAEPADLDLLALLEGTNDAIENRFDDGLRLLAGKLCDTQNLFDKVGLRECGLLGHRRYASSRNSRLKTALVRPPFSVVRSAGCPRVAATTGRIALALNSGTKRLTGGWPLAGVPPSYH